MGPIIQKNEKSKRRVRKYNICILKGDWNLKRRRDTIDRKERESLQVLELAYLAAKATLGSLKQRWVSYLNGWHSQKCIKMPTLIVQEKNLNPF